MNWILAFKRWVWAKVWRIPESCYEAYHEGVMAEDGEQCPYRWPENHYWQMGRELRQEPGI